MAFGGYVNQAQIIAAAAQTETQANLQRLLNLLNQNGSGIAFTANTVTGTGLPMAHPDFDRLHPETRAVLIGELVALKAAIAAAPAA